MANFKTYYEKSESEKNELIDSLFESLYEAAGTFYNLTTPGMAQVFTKSFDIPPDVKMTTNFEILNAKNAEDVKRIKQLSSEKNVVDFVMFKLRNSRIVKPSVDADFYEVGTEFFTKHIPLKAETAEQKKLLNDIDVREKRRDKTVKDTSKKLTSEELPIFLDIYKNTAPSEFVKGFYYLYDTEDDVLYKIIYNKQDPSFAFDNLFVESKPYAGPSETSKFKISGKAQHIEEAQVLGLFFDAPGMIPKIESFQKEFPDLKIPFENPSFRTIVKPFEKALDASPDFKSFVDVIKRDYKNFGYGDWYAILYLAGGMTLFNKEVSKLSKPFIVFKSMPVYKKLESEKLGYKDDEYGKVSTVDVLVTDTEDMLKFFQNEKCVLRPTTTGKIQVVVDGTVEANYWQISLKESIEHSQLGRGQRYFGKVYGMSTKAKEVFESFSYEQLDESLASKLSDVAKKGVKKLKEIGKLLFDKIKYLFTALKEWGVDVRNKISISMSKNILNDANKLFGLSLTEDVKNEITNVVLEVLSNPEKNYNIANNKIQTLLSKMESSKHSDLYLINYAETKKPNKISEKTFTRQIFNYSFLNAFSDVLYRSKNPVAEYVDELLGLYTEAVYGATRLPVWKVYSINGGHKPYEYIGSKESAKSERKENILSNLKNEDMPLIVLNVMPGNMGVHTIDFSMLTNVIGEDGKFNPIYTLFLVEIDKNLSPSFKAVREFELKDLPKSDK